MAEDRAIVVAGAAFAGLAAAALGLVVWMRSSDTSKPKPARVAETVRIAEPTNPPVVPANPRTTPELSTNLQEEQDRVFTKDFASARKAIRELRYSDAELELELLRESHPAHSEELDLAMADLQRGAMTEFQAAAAEAESDPKATAALEAFLHRAPTTLAESTRKACRAAEARRLGVVAQTPPDKPPDTIEPPTRVDQEAVVAAEKLATAGKFRDAAEAMDTAVGEVAGEIAEQVRARASWMRRLARYEGVLDSAALLKLAPEVLDTVEANVEAYITTSAPEKRNDVFKKLTAVANLTPDLVAAVVLRGGTFKQFEPGDTVEEYTLPGGEKRQVLITVPKGYRPDRLWPVFLHLHGTNGTLELCKSWAPYYRDLSNGRFIVAQPVSARNSGWGPMKIGEQQPPAVLEFLRARFPIDPDRVWLAGQSMGSHGTWHQAMRHADLYACYLPKSGTPYGAYGRNWEAYLGNLRFGPSWSIHGAKDSMFPIDTPRKFWKLCEEKKLNVMVHEFAQSGHEGAPEEEVRKSFAWMVEQVRVPYPKAFEWTCDSEEFVRCSWIEMTKLSTRVKRDKVQFVDQAKQPVETRSVMEEPARIEVKADGQTIALETWHIEKVRVWWNPAVLDLSKEVTITVNGKRKWKGVPVAATPSSVRAMLDDVRRTGRRDVVFFGSVEVDAP